MGCRGVTEDMTDVRNIKVEIPRRQLAGLGQSACKGEWGVEPFKNNTRDITDFAKRSGRLPQQRDGDEIDFRSILHRDGSVLSAPTLAVSYLPLKLILSCPSEAWQQGLSYCICKHKQDGSFAMQRHKHSNTQQSSKELSNQASSPERMILDSRQIIGSHISNSNVCTTSIISGKYARMVSLQM